MASRRLVLATGNPGKLREFQALLAPRWTVLPQTVLGVAPIPETGTTFLENALLKARHAAQAANLPALADDSGLEVDALDGAPGVHSARYAGAEASDADNNRKLLAALAGLPAAARGARFRCVLVCVRDAVDREPLVADASWAGEILLSPRGSGGFGYDSLFLDLETGRSAAELAESDKNRRSHRAKALQQLDLRLLEKLGRKR